MTIWTKLILAILIFVMLAGSALMAFVGSGDSLRAESPFDAGVIFGRVLGSVALPFLVLGLFQIFERFRNQSSRWKIVFWSTLLFFIISIVQLPQSVR